MKDLVTLKRREIIERGRRKYKFSVSNEFRQSAKGSSSTPFCLPFSFLFSDFLPFFPYVFFFFLGFLVNQY